MKVICFGDSNTYGYDPRSWLGGRYAGESRWVDILASETGWEIINRGENGREIPGAGVKFPEDTDLLIVMLGINDLLQGRTPQATSERMERFLSALDVPVEDIILIAPPQVTAGEWVQEQELIEDSIALTGLYRRLAQKLGIGFADGGRWGVEMSYDGVHFTEDGHRAFARGLYGYLSEMRSAPDNTAARGNGAKKCEGSI